MKRSRLSPILLLVPLLLGAVLANGAPSVDWDVIAGGGGSMEAADHALSGTVGQAVVGMVADTELELCSGYWCRTEISHRILLPIVIRND